MTWQWDSVQDLRFAHHCGAPMGFLMQCQIATVAKSDADRICLVSQLTTIFARIEIDTIGHPMFRIRRDCGRIKLIRVFSARQHICYSALYAIVRPSVRHTGGSVKGG